MLFLLFFLVLLNYYFSLPLPLIFTKEEATMSERILDPFLSISKESEEEVEQANKKGANEGKEVSENAAKILLKPVQQKEFLPKSIQDKQSGVLLQKEKNLEDLNLLKSLKKKYKESQFKIKNLLALSLNSLPLILSLDKNLDRIVGIHPFIKELGKDGFYGKNFPALFKIPSYVSSGTKGEYPHVQSIIQLRAELIVYAKSLIETKDFLDFIKKYQIKSYKLSEKDEESFIQDVKNLSILLNQEEEAKKILDHRESIKLYLKNKLGTLAKHEKPKVLVLNWLDDGYQIASNAHFDQLSLDLSGGQSLLNSEDYGGHFVEKEWIIKNHPDYIFLYSQSKKFLHPDMIYQDSDFQLLPAVKKKQVYVIPFVMNFWNQLDIEAPLYWVWISKILHHERMKNFNFMKFMNNCYKIWTEKNMRYKDQLEALNWNVNQISSYYDILTQY